MASTIMVTGGTGFVGTYITRALAMDGHRVITYDIRPPAPELVAVLQPVAGQVVYENGQITDLARLLEILKRHRVEHVVNNAALFDVPLSLEQPAITYTINVNGLINVCEAARLLGLGRVVQASSGAVIVAKRSEPIDEYHPISDPTMGHSSAYGASKAMAEIVGMTYYEQGVDFLALRYSAVYGFGMRSPIRLKPLVEGAVHGQPVRIPTGASFLSDFTYVRDQAQAVRCALAADSGKLSQRIYSVSGTSAHTAAEVARMVREIVPGADIEVGEGMTEWDAKDNLKRAPLDVAKAEADLGYWPKYDMRRGLTEYVDLLRAYEAGQPERLAQLLE
jgi:UDP-glucose 4-epimerase